MAELQMTDENRPYIEALMRMTLGIRDLDAEQTLLDGIQELVALRAKQERAVDWLLEAIKDLRGVPRNAEYVVTALRVLVGEDRAHDLIGALDEQLRVDRLAREASGDPDYQPAKGDMLFTPKDKPAWLVRSMPEDENA